MAGLLTVRGRAGDVAQLARPVGRQVRGPDRGAGVVGDPLVVLQPGQFHRGRVAGRRTAGQAPHAADPAGGDGLGPPQPRQRKLDSEACSVSAKCAGRPRGWPMASAAYTGPRVAPDCGAAPSTRSGATSRTPPPP
ncbi:hypothetical protein O1L55_30890 [Streptomyces albulus]|nr:hypothetical protein [Streptomyces noursei]